MPWSVSDVDKHIKGLSDTEKKRWVATANSCLADGKDDGTCVRLANGVVSKNKETQDVVQEVLGEKYQYIESWDYSERQITQDAAAYNPLGATDTQGCANCQWFIAPSRCAVVAGEIAPTGLSNMWRAKTVYEMAPIPVYIVDNAKETAPLTADEQTGGSSKSLMTKVMDAVSNVFAGQSSSTSNSAHAPRDSGEALPTTFALAKQKDGTLRFLAAWSNNFYDREGEVFPEYAHKEFAEHCETTGSYPELWMWHTIGSKYGQVDWIDVTDGFIYASGTIDPGKEALAEKMVEEGVGLSHGFYGIQRGNEIAWYRSYEISTLPRANAAVWTTSFDLLTEGVKDMGFTQQRKEFLKNHGFSDEQIIAAEANATKLNETLKGMGVAYKDADLEPDPPAPAAAPAQTAAAAPAAPAAATASTTVSAPTTEASGDKSASTFESQMIASMERLTAAVLGVTQQVNGLETRVKSVERTDDQRVADAMAPRAQPTSVGVSASKDAGNIVDQGQVNKDIEFFGKTFYEPFGITLPVPAQPATAQ